MGILKPDRGIIFWPIGNGDSTTICITKDTVAQVDLHHMEKSNERDDPHVAIIDELIKILPRKDNKPFLSAFILTHPDKDHIQGFNELLKKVKIGEIWHTPRVFREYNKDLCDDAISFKSEVKRRAKIMIEKNGNVTDGDRVRLIGYDDYIKENKDYKDFPQKFISVPGSSVEEINGVDHSDVFRAFIHAPFKEDSENDRNETSLAMQVRLINDKCCCNFMLLGDLSYLTIKKIYERSDSKDVKWDVLLSPHHCSKKVMYWKGENDVEEKLKQDILDDLKKSGEKDSYIIASSEPIPTTNKTGDNPPHAKAKNRYEEIVSKEFICTMEHKGEDEPQPIVFELDGDNLKLKNEKKKMNSIKETLGGSIVAARGNHEPPSTRTGFGLL
ncbi:MAG: hypothetical protein IPM32_08830 [Ignavibacteriae bacterium]|nr:hypothetical protein [Ignavibacteriota bacterium]